MLYFIFIISESNIWNRLQSLKRPGLTSAKKVSILFDNESFANLLPYVLLPYIWCCTCLYKFLTIAFPFWWSLRPLHNYTITLMLHQVQWIPLKFTDFRSNLCVCKWYQVAKIKLFMDNSNKNMTTLHGTIYPAFRFQTIISEIYWHLIGSLAWTLHLRLGSQFMCSHTLYIAKECYVNGMRRK